MQLLEISPFIRFAAEVTVPKRTNAAYCTDCRLMLITEGTGRVYINKRDFDFSAGTLMFWQAGTCYRFAFHKTVQVLVIDFDLISNGKNAPAILPLVLSDTDNEFSVCRFSDAEVLNAPIIMDNAFFAEERMRQIINEFKKKTIYGEVNASAYLKLCIAETAKRFFHRQDTSEQSKTIDLIVNHIQKHITDDLSNKRLAELVGYHPYYLNRVFKQVKGIALHQYVLNCRLTLAAETLLSTTHKVSEIAELSGFNNQISFINAFKKRYGVPPTAFRKNSFHI